eukprot:gene11233-11318_t
MGAGGPAMTGVVVVVPVLNEARTIERVLHELLDGMPPGAACAPASVAAEIPALEIVVADGGSTDGTQARVAAVARADPRVRLAHNPRRVQSAAINLVARQRTDAQWLIRADAHAAYPAGFVTDLVATLERTGADSVVVPMDSRGTGCMARAIAWVSDTPVGSGGSAHRGGQRAGWIDHGHHAGWNLASYLAAGGYDESYSHNEDAEFDCRLRRSGGRIWIEPSIRLGYFVRPTLGALWRQYRNYGRGRSRTVRRHPSSLRLRQLLVPAGVAAISVASLAAPFAPVLWVVPGAYVAVLASTSLGLAARHRSLCGLAAGAAAMVMHFGWAWGFAGGLIGQRETPPHNDEAGQCAGGRSNRAAHPNLLHSAAWPDAGRRNGQASPVMTFDAIIAIPTFRRPAGLQRLLASLQPSLDRARVAVIVGDNACDDQTRQIVEHFARAYPATRYLPVPERGISQNRNALLAAFRAMPLAPWLGMLDDDLVAPPDWLDQMIAAGCRHDADIVGGPYVIDAADRPVSRLVRNSILLNRPSHATGPVEMFHAGGNVLMARRLLMREPLLWFDPGLGRSGGEDSEFLSRAKAQGARFAWAAKAQCFEDFPLDRATARYVLNRYYSTGNSMAHISMAQRNRATVLALAARRLVASLARMVVCLARFDFDRAVQRAFDATWAVGGLGAVLGFGRAERYG